MKRIFSSMGLKEAMLLIPAARLTPWIIDAPPQLPSEPLQEWLRRLRVFNQTNSEAAKILLIDTLFAEIVPNYAHLRIWKAAALESASLTGVADYIIAPDYAYITTPLLCVAEAKRDDFVQGQA